jgi:xanthine dehydrogenase accessory factor
MAFTDAIYDGEATLVGVRARHVPDLPGVESCWRDGDAVPMVTIPEVQILAGMTFDVLVEATMRRYQMPPDARALAPLVIGLGPGYVPGENCHVAIETQWGERMGAVLRDRPAADRGGGPRPLDGIARGRFAIAPCSGVWHSDAVLGLRVEVDDVLGRLGDASIRAPIAGHVRGVTRSGIEVRTGQRLLEIDPRSEPQVFGLGERPLAIAGGVAEALGMADTTAQGGS